MDTQNCGSLFYSVAAVFVQNSPFGIEPGSPALQADSLAAELPGKPKVD